jgi:uncharacterized repeat protein (TIGR01451 family)
MSYYKTSLGRLSVFFVLSLILLLAASPVRATHVDPVFVPGNPTCSVLAPAGVVWFELKVEPVADGTYTDGILVVTVDVRDTTDGPVFDWTSNIGVDAVFVKGGPNGNFYQYDPPGPEATADTGLHAPVNPQNNQFFGLSHISFCYDVAPSIAVEKSGDTLSKVGDTVTYDFTITNDGDIPLHLDAINDTVLGDLAAAATAAGCDPLAAGASCSFSVNYEIPAGAPDPLENTVTVEYSGTLPDSTSTSVSDAASHSVNLFQPSIQFEKTGDERSKAGDTVSYTLTLDNTSSADSPDLLCTISDPLIGVNEQVTLASGEQHVINTSYTVQAGDADPLVNTASVECTVNGFPNVLTAEDSHSVNLFQPSVEVDKSGNTLSKVGDTVTYEFQITNTSSDDSPVLVLDSVSDTVLGDLTATASAAGCATLPFGASCQFSVDYTIQGGDPDPLENTVTVHYHPDGFPNDITAADDHAVNLFQPSIRFEKTGDERSKVGDKVNYALTLENTSSADSPDLICTITDVLLGVNEQVTLASANEHVINAEYTVQAGAPDPLMNTASVSCQVEGFPNVLTAADSHTVNLFQPAIEFEKTGDALSKVGDEVHYTLTVRNMSSADSPNLSCTITDPLLGLNEAAVLAPGADHVVNTSYTVQAGDADPLVNTATVECTVNGFPNTLHAEASHSVNLFQPAVTVAKDGPTSAEVGETITYDFDITNSGSSDSPDLVLDSVSDTVLGDLTATAQAAGCTSLAVGASCQFTVDYTIQSSDPNPLVNVVTVRYHPDGFPNEVQDEAEHSVEILVANEGCTPGYWKNHLDAWAGYSPDQTVESVFDVPDALGLDNDTLLTALNYGGGPGQIGAAQILLRAAVAALLNAANPDVGYPRTEIEIIAAVNTALASGNRSTMLALATALDADNNLGCPLNGGDVESPLLPLQVVYLPMVNR